MRSWIDTKKLNDATTIVNMVSRGKHLGTWFLKGIPGCLKTKTFNTYLQEDGTYLVTNHYGDQLINATIYDDTAELEEAFPEGLSMFHRYTLPLLP